MSKRLVVTGPARRDLRNIQRFISRSSPVAAESFVRDLADKMRWIAEVEFTGSPRDHLSQGLRALPYRSRTIYYRHDETSVRILRVMHDAQNVDPTDFERPA